MMIEGTEIFLRDLKISKYSNDVKIWSPHDGPVQGFSSMTQILKIVSFNTVHNDWKLSKMTIQGNNASEMDDNQGYMNEQ